MDKKDLEAGLRSIPSLEQDRRIRQLEQAILELHHEIMETRREVRDFRGQEKVLHMGPMCQLPEGHEGSCLIK